MQDTDVVMKDAPSANAIANQASAKSEKKAVYEKTS